MTTPTCAVRRLLAGSRYCTRCAAGALDEIDAVGSRRGGARLGGNDEREQTLNQLLAEMDGFDQSSGIVAVLMASYPNTAKKAVAAPVNAPLTP